MLSSPERGILAPNCVWSLAPAFLFVCFTRYLVFRIAVLPHRPGVVYYHLLLRREIRIPGVALFSFRIGIWDLFVHRGQKSYTHTPFGKLWTTPGVRCMKLISFEMGSILEISPSGFPKTLLFPNEYSDYFLLYVFLLKCSIYDIWQKLLKKKHFLNRY